MAWALIVVGAVISAVNPVLGAFVMFPGIVVKLSQRRRRSDGDRPR